jgi:hypothetical protein
MMQVNYLKMYYMNVVRLLFRFLILIVITSSCRVPRDSLTLFNDNNGFNAKLYTRIPCTWDARLLAYSAQTGTGGEASHTHGFMHDHTGTSGKATTSIAPLGLQNPTVSEGHTHKVETYLQSPQVTGAAPYEVRSKELTAYITRRGLRKVPAGLIVLYIGNRLPVGWKPCDGSAGTPDLRGVYIRVRQQNSLPTATGSNTHIHNVTHGHKWGVFPPDNGDNRNKALAVDEIVLEGDTITINVFQHIHAVKEEPLPPTYTKLQDILPPSMFVGFIMAGPAVRKIPSRAILPTVKQQKPWGWQRWILNEVKDLRFLQGTLNHTEYLQLFGSAMHTHVYDHSHTVQLTAFPHKILQTSKHDLPAVARAHHNHVFDTSASDTTAASASLPLFLSLSYIIKK